MRCRRAAAASAAVLALLPTVSGPAAGEPAALRIGALFPLSGPQAAGAADEFRGVELARDLTNADGGVGGRPITLESREVDARRDAAPAVASLRHEGVPVIIGTYSSELSLPASAAAAAAGITYWEAGAVADRVTGRGLPGIFRVGATGTNLGTNSARFAVEQLAPRLGRSTHDLRVSIVYEDDDYGRSVAGSALATASAAGATIASNTPYDPYAPRWEGVLATVAAARPDVLVLASYIPDGVAFRRAMLESHLRVGALIGSTMAECGPEFGALLGADAIGVFASDRPTAGFNPAVLLPEGRATYERFAAAWTAATGRAPTEEALAGFAAAWALFHHVLPRAQGLDPSGIAEAARSTLLPVGTLPNGAGLEFATSPAQLGQNLSAAAVIWQWQGVRRSVTVWPPPYATGTVRFVPLPA